MRRPKGRAAAILFTLSAMGLAAMGSAPSLASAPALQTRSPYAFTTGLPWADTSGKLIQGHNGSIIQPTGSSAYYWVGQNLANTGKRQDAACYQSTDLVHWTPVAGFSLSVANLPLPAAAPPGGFWLLGTTKLIEASSGQFVIWASMKVHDPASDTNSDPDVDVATSSSPCGQYTWQGQAGQAGQDQPWQPQANGASHPVGDIGLFKDTTNGGTAYLLTSDADGGSCTAGTKNCILPLTKPPAPNVTPCPSGATNCVFEAGVRIFQLQGPGDTQIQGTSSDFDLHQPNGQGLEAPAMFFNASSGLYYVLISETTNWKPNPNLYSSSSSPAGGWTQPQPIDVKASSSDGPTCDSQTMWVQPVQGTGPPPTSTYIYMGDRWDSSNISDGPEPDSLGDSSYVWLPLTFTDGGGTSTSPPVPTLDCSIHNWSLSTSTGNWVNLGPNFPDAMFTLTTNDGSGQVMTTSGTGNTSLASGNGDPQQQLQITEETYTPGDTNFTPRYEIRNVASGQVLQDDGGTLVQAAPGAANKENCTGSTATDQSPLPAYQEWQFVSVSNSAPGEPEGLMLKNICTGKVAEDLTNGTTLETAPAAATVGQQWLLTEVPSFWAYTSDGNVYNQHGAPWFGHATASDVIGLAATPDGEGYWLVDANGAVWNFGDASPVTTLIPTKDCSTGKIAGVAPAGPGGGFYAFTACGNVYSEAGANGHGSLAPGVADVVGLAATPDGSAYWLAESDGAVTYFNGTTSVPSSITTKDCSTGKIAGVAADPAGGYYAFSGCGNVYNEAGANWFKSLANSGFTDVKGFAVTPDGNGYWLVRTNGTVYAFGDATSGANIASGVIGAVGNPNM